MSTFGEGLGSVNRFERLSHLLNASRRAPDLAKRLVYKVVDFCTGYRGILRVVSGEAIRFPARWCRYYSQTYEPEKFAFLREHCRPGDVVIDVGAHIGLFTVLMARLVGQNGRVISFEPTALTRRALARTVRMNGCEQVVEVRAEAVSRQAGTSTFYDTGVAASNANSLVANARGVTEVQVPTISIDGLAAERNLAVTVLKIDAEGAELDILEGARATLLRDRPCVQLEVHPTMFADRKGTLVELWKLFQEVGLTPMYGGNAIAETWFTELEHGVELQLVPSRNRADQQRE